MHYIIRKESFLDVQQRLREALQHTLDLQTLKKLVLSRPNDKTVLRAEARLITLRGEAVLQVETFLKDGKALHRNLPLDVAVDEVLSMASDFRQLNLLTTAGDLERRVSSKGKEVLLGKLGAGPSVTPRAHDREKKTVLHPHTYYPFLHALGVTDGTGEVIERKRAKFRQIDRFLQYVDELLPHLPSGDLYLLDLCCGKSYLTFACYWFLTEVKGRTVVLHAVDRKQDVIRDCAALAERLGYTGLTFFCMDIADFTPKRRPDLVLSLHACDIATDIVLVTAAKLGAEAILSTPCCQHEIFSQLSDGSPLGKALSPIVEHSLLKQKLAVALTDALRCKRLQAEGYEVEVTELIDPENTPKNLMIRALRGKIPPARREQYRREYEELSSFAGVSLFGGAPAAAPHATIIYKEEK